MIIIDWIRSNVFAFLFLCVFGYAVYKFFIATEDNDSDSDSDSDDDASDDSKTFDENDKRPRMRILYGTQTGTAEDYAKMLQSDADRHGFNTVTTCIAEYDPATELAQETSILVVVVATYGDGEPTDDSRDFYDFLKEQQQTTFDLSKIQYTVFGLGNKQYKIYQGMARFMDKRLAKLGAERLYPRGEGDADALMEEDFEEWKAQMLGTLSKKFNTTVSDAKIEAKHTITWIENEKPSIPFNVASHIPDSKLPYLATVKVNKQLLNGDSERSTIHVEIDISDSRIRYEAGDHLAVYPKNKKTIVYHYASRLGVKDKLKMKFSMTPKSNDLGHVYPRICSLEDVLTYFTDLTHLPRKNFIRAMAAYASDKEEAKELALLADNSEQGKRAYDKKVRKPCRTAVDLLCKYKSVDMPLELFFELMPHLAPRYYSIASSKQLNPTSIHVVIAVVRYDTSTGQREGVASSYLESLKPGEKAYVYVRESSFHLPSNLQTPLLLIGPGTGYAPLRGFLQQRRGLMEKRSKKVGDALLFFGCRHREEDFIYGDEMTNAQRDGVISSLNVAFSRDQEEKVYVQHLIAQQKEDIWKLLEAGGYIFICGDAKYMAKDVHTTLTNIVKECGKFNDYDTEKYMNKLEKDERYLKDVWAP